MGSHTHPISLIRRGSLWLLVALTPVWVGCASTFSIKSDPLAADVFVIDPKSGEKKPLGKTPLEFPTSALKQAAGNDVMSGQYFTLAVEKSGYISEKIGVPSSKFGTLVTQLDVKMKAGSNVKEQALARDVLNQLFLAQKFAIAKEFDRAQAQLDQILSVFPDFARALSMRASIYYMQKNYPESLKWYEEAAKADPQLDDAVKMIAKVRALQEGRAPASATPATPPPGDKKP